MAMQLWIGGVRIDSISMLRGLFASVTGDVLDARCDEVLGKIADGIFIPWLDRCAETRKRDVVAKDSGSRWRDVLYNEPDKEKLSDDAQRALAMICEVPEERITDAVKRKFHADRNAFVVFSEFKDVIARQTWYRDDSVSRQTLEGVRWDRVAIDSNTLQNILARLPQDNSPVDVFLCNVGHPFIIRVFEGLTNVRLIGLGNPDVRFAANHRGKYFDMVKQNVKFKNFRLACLGVLLVNEYGRHINVEIQP